MCLQRRFSGLWLSLLCLFSATGGAAEPLRLVTLEYPPYVTAREGAVEGIATEVIREAFSRIDQPVSVQVLPWARALLYIETGKADAIFTIFKNEDREKFADYSQQILFEQTISLFTLSKSAIEFDGQLESLSRYRFCVVNKVSYGELFDQAVTNGVISKIERTSSTEQCAQMLKRGRVDIWINNTFGGLDVAKELGLINQFKTLSPTIESTASYIAFSKKRNHAGLRDRLDKALDSMKQDGTYSGIIERYFADE